MSDTRTVLFELGTEELPPASLQFFWASLRDVAVLGLKAAGLVDRDLRPEDLPELYAARRLALEIPAVRPETKSEEEIRRGPALKVAFNERGEPTKALLGFARSCGAGEGQIKRWSTGEDCERTEKGAWVRFARAVPSRSVQEVLPEIFGRAVSAIPLDARMRWGTSDSEFARPVRWVVLLYGNEVVSGSLMDIEFGRESCGHRFFDSGPIVIDHAKSYRDRLHENRVSVSWPDRRRALLRQIMDIDRELRREYGAQVVVVRDTVILEKNLSSAEWPQAVRGSFDKRFLKLPNEVVVTVLEEQQQCFSVRKLNKEKGQVQRSLRVASNTLSTVEDRLQEELVPHFVAVANLPDKSGRIRTGCERVVQARLQDAEFYLRQDQQRSLEDRVADLEQVVFHRKLGTLADRTRRIEALAGFLAKIVGVDETVTIRAAHLCKADLGTDMVQAFPNLQGLMGAHYARAEGESEAVCLAIAEHYWPRPFLGQAVSPFELSGPGLTLVLADRLDMLMGIFAIGEIPTGAGDPLGVRRAAHDAVYLMLYQDSTQVPNMPEIDMSSLLRQAAKNYPRSLNASEAVPMVRDYLADRLRSLATQTDRARDEITATLAASWRNPQDVFSRLEALQHFRRTEAGAALAEANKRIRNILRKTEAPAGDLDPELLREPAEKALAERVAALRPEVEKLCRERQYEQAMEQLAALADPVAKFFDDVLVMAEEPEMRHNRLRLLRDVRELFLTIADLSRLQGAPKAAEAP